jgi:hypothetical protein
MTEKRQRMKKTRAKRAARTQLTAAAATVALCAATTGTAYITAAHPPRHGGGLAPEPFAWMSDLALVGATGPGGGTASAGYVVLPPNGPVDGLPARPAFIVPVRRA